jgi:hypothetical protein
MLTTGGGFGARLWLRSLLPSAISLVVSFILSLFITGGHLLALSVSGQAYPTNLNDILLSGYANYIIGPVTRLINSNWLNIVLLAIGWGAFGMVVYELIAHFAGTVRNIRLEHESITEPTVGVVRRHPLEGSLLLHIAWRIFIVLLSLLLTVAFVPILDLCLTSQLEVFRATSVWQSLRAILISSALLMLVLHCYLVLLRWYMFRTRVTGEILY